MTNTYFIDSGCTRTIVCNLKHIKNLHEITPKRVKGLTGFKTYNLAGDLHFPLNDDQNTPRILIVKDALFDPGGNINLIATEDLNATNWDVHFSQQPSRSGLFLYNNIKNPSECTHVARVALRIYGKLRTLTVDSQLPYDYSPSDSTCFHALCGSMSLEELMHERMAHAPIPKLSKMSHQVDGLPRPLSFAKVLRIACATCDEAKAKRQDYPDASTTESENEDDLITWDLIDMGKAWTSLGGNRYISIFIIKRSRYAIAILSKDLNNFEGVLCKAIAKAGFTPKRIRCDCAGEYVSSSIQDFLASQNITAEYSNPHEQFGNSMSEKFVDTLGKLMRVLLLQSHLPPEFRGACVLFDVNVYNHLPHDSIDGRIPHAVHHGVRPDVSWFRPFGCHATLFRGSDLVEHHKLAGSGWRGVFVGLCMSHGRKCWLIYVPGVD